MKVLLAAGGAGFTGTNFISYFLKRNKNFIVINIDKISSPSSMSRINELDNSPRHNFIKGDICNYELVNYIFRKFRPDYVINFSSESLMTGHTRQPLAFAQTDITGTITLLENARHIWSKTGYKGNRFIQVSTDEVYGTYDNDRDYLQEDARLSPSDPFTAAKAGADLIASSFHQAYGLPVVIARCCSLYGPYQGSGAFVPGCIINALNNKPAITSDADCTREWMHVIDGCIALIRLIFYAKPGETYNIGTGCTASELDLSGKILGMLGKMENEPPQTTPRSKSRYRILNSYKAKCDLNWSGRLGLEEGLKDTILWYRDNPDWWDME